jgi:hypothetical protein
MRTAILFLIALAGGCARKHPHFLPPLQPQEEPAPPPEDTATTTRPAAPTTTPPPAPATRELPASLIVYAQYHYNNKSLVASGPIRGVAPDAVATEVTLVNGNNRDIKLTNHLVGGLSEDTRQNWISGLRAGTIATVPTTVDALTPDDHAVSRCKGGVGEDFELCTYDATGGARRVVLHDKAIADDAATVAGAGGTRVLVRYTSNTRPPFAYDLATDKRHDLPGLGKKSKSVERSIISPSGALAARCYLGNAKATLVIADLEGNKPDRTIAIGDLLRCDCKFSPDDHAIACGVLPNKREYFSKPDRLLAIDLASGRQTYLNDTVTSFVFSPDGHDVAHISNASSGKGLALFVTPAAGGTGRELAPWSVDRPLVGWVAP